MSRFQRSLAWFVSVVIILFILAVLLPFFFRSTYDASFLPRESQLASTQNFQVTHTETPEPLKALYMTSCVASQPSWRNDLKRLIETTELNAVVIDIKDYTGEVSFAETSECFVPDLKEFIAELHGSDIYVIGRISVFQDPSYTKLFPELAVKKKPARPDEPGRAGGSDGEVWKDYKGLSFVDVGATPYWDYIIELSKKSYEIGFDELNYDYVRYPSDGDMQDTSYTWTVGTTTKPAMLENFFKHLHDNLENTGVKLSADLFGMTTTVENDMNIGQVLENALPYFDYISPMVYPSHYPPTWNGFANPAEHPYEVVKISMARAVEREQLWLLSNNMATSTPSKMRPWLQDFHLGATYGEDKVRAQIQATYDVGLTSWMLWNAGNKYTEAALLSN